MKQILFYTLVLLLGACSSVTTKHGSDSNQPTKTPTLQSQSPAGASNPVAANQSAGLTAPVATNQNVTQTSPKVATSSDNSHGNTHVDQHAQNTNAAHHETGVDPDKAQSWLKNGNQRFIKHKLRKDGQSAKDVSRLYEGQHPHSIVLSCSDSRVPPEVVFDQKLGELFVVRTAGQSLASNAVGSVEYAVEHLGARNIVVIGHTKCGAVKASLDTINGADAGSKSLNELVSDLHPHLQNFKGKDRSKDLVDEGWANVDGVGVDLLARSKIISDKIKSGEIKIRKGLYDLKSGVVTFR